MKRWQFSIRTLLFVIMALAACLSIALVQRHRWEKQKFVERSVQPITEKYVASVGFNNGQILWLGTNGISPHHSNNFDEWAVPIKMDMSSNDGSFGPYKAIDDHALQMLVTNHPHIRALYLRHSPVTSAGLRHLAKLKELEWLWIDDRQSTELGLSYLKDLPSLHTIGLDLDLVDPALVRELQKTRADSEIENNATDSRFSFSLDQPADAPGSPIRRN